VYHWHQPLADFEAQDSNRQKTGKNRVRVKRKTKKKTEKRRKGKKGKR